MPSEKTIMQGILMLSSKRIRLFRNNCGIARYYNAAGDDMRVEYGVGQPGGSDIIGIRTIIRGGVEIGQFVALEVKAKGKNPTPKQRQFLEVIRGLGGLAAVVRSVEEAEKLLNEE